MTEETMIGEENGMIRFFREQLINQAEQLAAQVRKMDDTQILNRRFQRDLHDALVSLADAQGIYPESDRAIPPF